jgi:hypothetical protein
VLALAGASTGQAGERYKNYQHAQYVCTNGKNGVKRHACKHVHKYIPRGEAALRAYINDDCLEDIIEWETGGAWSTTIWNGRGSGAYGLPQALPASKMRSHGADYMTNPITQISWMRSYVNARYGGSCNARAFKIRNGWY